MTRLAKSLAFVLLLVSLSPALYARDYLQDDYVQGRQAAERGEWRDVVRLMTVAISHDRNEREAHPYGAIYISYYPFYYRGIAYYKLGEYENALEDLKQTKGPGKQGRRLEDIGDLIHQAEQRIAAAKQPATPPAREPERPAVVATAPPVTAPVEARPPAQPPAAAATDKPATPPQVEERTTIVSEAADDVIAKTKVRGAVDDYFKGNFVSAEKQFIALVKSDQKSNAKVWLFLAATRYYRYELGGAKDESLRTAAISAYRRARELNRNATFDRRFFSPRLQRYFAAENR